MDNKKAKEIIRRGEGQHIEFKKSLSEDNEAIKSLCAFTNADGGTVFFGVVNDNEYLGISLGKNTLENFANKLRRETSPPLSPSIEEIRFGSVIIVAVTVQKAELGQLFHAFNTPFIRVGKTNQVMSPDEQRTRLISGKTDWSEERDRPTFEIIYGGLTRTENSFEPSWRLKQVSGDYVRNLEWRFRGPRFRMNWQQAAGFSLETTNISGKFDLSRELIEDDKVGINEMALEIRISWRGSCRHELHRWPITRRELPTKTLWDVDREKLPPLTWDE